MKKIFKTHPGRIGFAVLLLLSAIIIHSCRKETKQTQQEVNSAIAATNFSVKDAATWFTGNKTALANKIKIKAEASFLKDISDFTPVWDSARTALDTNYYVVEAPAKYVKKLGFNTDSTATNVNGLTRLLVLKSKKYGTTSAVLMHIHGSPGINTANVHYMDIPQNFSGNIFYTSIQGASINGYIYKNGKITKVSSGKGSSTKPAGPQIMTELAPGECETYVTDWYVQACYYNGAILIGCDEWQYVFSTYDTYCAPINPYGGSGGVNPPDCPPGDGGGGGPAVESVNGKLVVRLVEPGDGGDSPCVTCEQTTYDFFNNSESFTDHTTNSITDILNSSLAPNTRQKKYDWTFVKNVAGHWWGVSYEVGTHKWVSDHFEWVSLTHITISLERRMPGGDVELKEVDSTPTIVNPNSAYMSLKVTKKVAIVCKGFPYAQSQTFSANSDLWSLR